MSSIARFAIGDKVVMLWPICCKIYTGFLLLTLVFAASSFYNRAMKKKLITLPLLRIYISLGIAAVLVLTPLSAFAAPKSIEPVIITEVQVGSAISGSQEFIELYNQSASAIDLTANEWRVQIATSKATTWDKSKTVELDGLFYPGTYLLISSNYVVAGETKSYLQDYATAQFAPGMTATSGHVRVVHKATTLADTQAGDVLQWSAKDDGKPVSAGIDDGPVLLLETSIPDGASLKRATDDHNIFMTSDDPARDFLLSSCPSPTSNNKKPSSPDVSQVEPLATTIDITNPACADSDSDNGDGTTDPTEDPPAVLLPSEESTDAGSGAKTRPRLPAADIGLASPQISELLPNPASPQTDAQDEFIELYNSNTVAFDLSGFIVEVGTRGSKRYTFPEGTVIAPRSFKAFFSGDTHASLSNTSGQVKLLDPFEKLLSKTDPYSTAKDNQAWAVANGTWQWTTKPSPNATNTIAAPVAKSTKSKASAAKTTTKKTTAGSSKQTTPVKAADMTMASSTQSESPLHPLALAVAGGFALLYGGYEYRHDLANKFHQFRIYRATRRKNRQRVARR